MGKKYDSPPPLNYDKLLENTEMILASNEKVAADYLEFGKEALDMQMDVTERTLAVQLPAMEEEAEQARKMRERYNEQGIPVEDAYLKKLSEWDTPERREQRAGEVQADTTAADEQARMAEEMRMRSYGIDPSQTRAASTEGMRSAMLAAEVAKGRQAARREVEGQGLALGGEAVNIYRGLPSQTAQSYATSTAASGAANQSASALGQAGSNMYGTASSMYGQSANILNQGYGTANSIYGNQIQNASNQMQGKMASMEMIGSMVGSAAGVMAMSDERTKEDVRKIGEYKGLPVYSYRYKEGFDQTGGIPEIGVMAQELEKVNPKAVEDGPIKRVNYALALEF